MRTLNLLLLFVSAASAHAAEPKIHRDLPYADTKNKLQTLDIYAPAEGTNHPVVLWIHGGGWHSGDKAEIDNKPRAFTGNVNSPASVQISIVAGSIAVHIPGNANTRANSKVNSENGHSPRRGIPYRPCSDTIGVVAGATVASGR